MKIKILALVIILFTSCAFAQGAQDVRVAIIPDTSSFRIKISGFYEVINQENKQVLYRGKDLNTTVAVYRNGILFGALKAKTERIFIKVDAQMALFIDGRQFSGNIAVKKIKNDGLLVVNYVPLENYIQGILYHEASHYWPMEALKAQAVVCRTYAVYQISENTSRDFDVTADIYSQVYGGKTSERYRTNEAVAATRAQVLVYKHKVFPAFFHATCAGHTENAALLWNVDLVPLRGVACNFCKGSPHYSWHEVMPLKTIEDKLNASGKRFKGIKNIVVLGNDPSGRITDLEIVCAAKNLKIPAKDFRNIIGPNVIRSTKFSVNVVEQDVVFEGLGWGHGAGLCQWGAYFMAKEGKTFEQILSYYYPESNVKTLLL